MPEGTSEANLERILGGSHEKIHRKVLGTIHDECPEGNNEEILGWPLKHTLGVTLENVLKELLKEIL